MTRGSQEPNPVFPLEQVFSLCKPSVHKDFKEQNYCQQEPTVKPSSKIGRYKKNMQYVCSMIYSFIKIMYV